MNCKKCGRPAGRLQEDGQLLCDICYGREESRRMAQEVMARIQMRRLFADIIVTAITVCSLCSCILSALTLFILVYRR